MTCLPIDDRSILKDGSLPASLNTMAIYSNEYVLSEHVDALEELMNAAQNGRHGGLVFRLPAAAWRFPILLFKGADKLVASWGTLVCAAPLWMR